MKVALLGGATSVIMFTLVGITMLLGQSLPHGGQIAFLSYRDLGSEIYLMDVNRVIEHNLSRSLAHEMRLAWSPDGERIAFLSAGIAAPNPDIYVMDAQGNRVRSLTNFSAGYLTFAWSPDSRRLAFESDHDGNFEIYVVDGANCLDGCQGNIRRLTHNVFRDFAPVWSPDGRRLLFVSYLDTGRPEIHSVSADGGSDHNLTYRTRPYSPPAWSPDGEKIIFTSWDGGSYEIYLMDARCVPHARRPDSSIPRTCENTLRNLPTDEAGVGWPGWSPTSQEFVFLSWRDGNTEIYRMDIYSGESWRLTSHPAEDRDPAWSPDGQWIAFVSNRGGTDQIYVMDRNGENVRLLTYTGTNISPAWRP